MSRLSRISASLFCLILFMMAVGPVRAATAAATFQVQTVTVLHDGRSVLIEATAPVDDGPFPLAAVDWELGWHADAAAMLTVVRGNSQFGIQLVFTGAPIRLENEVAKWSIYAWIPNPDGVVIQGDDLTIEIDEGWVQDSAGNTLGALGANDLAVINYSLVGTDGFIDEGQFAFDDVIYVNLSSTGLHAGDDQDANLNLEKVWQDAHSMSTPLLTLKRALELHNVLNQGNGSCAIRVRRGSSGTSTANQLTVYHGGLSLTEPLLISTYAEDTETGRPVITIPYNKQGIRRDAGATNAQYIYINGLHLRRIDDEEGAANYGISNTRDDSHFVISDCKIEGFYQNVALQVGSTPQNGQWWSIFRNIIVDAHTVSPIEGADHPQGIFADGCRKGLLISQNVLDHNGWIDNAYELNNIRSHAIYITGSASSGGFVWGNLLSRSGTSACQNRPGGVIYGNLIVDNADGGYVAGSAYQGGGRIARNYFERGHDADEEDTQLRGWGPQTSDGPNGPCIFELNCMANSSGEAPLSIHLGRSRSGIFPNPEIIVRNNTATKHGQFNMGLVGGDEAPPVLITSRNIWDSRNSPSAVDHAMNFNAAFANWDWDVYCDYNCYKSDNSNSVITIYISSLNLSTWQGSPYDQDQHSNNSTPTYEDQDYNLGDLAVERGFSQTPSIQAYYDAVRARARGDNNPDLLDFVSAAAYMIGKREETNFTVPWPSSDPLNFWGSGDGHDPQIP